VPLVSAFLLIGALAVARPSVLASENDQNGGPSRGSTSSKASQPQQGRLPGPPIQEWWNNPDVRKALNLDPMTVKKIDGIYRKLSSDLKDTIESFTSETQKLDVMTRAAVVDDSTYKQQVFKVETFRTEIIKSRTVMLYQMYRQLRPEQRTKLWAIFDEWRERAEAARERERSASGSPAHSSK